VLLDECEKADLEVMNLFYQVFDKGTLTDGEGREIDFKNTLIVLTSNLGSDLIMEAFAGSERPADADLAALIRPVLSGHFKPALLARMSVVPFAPLPREVLREVVDLKLATLARRLHENHAVQAAFAPDLLDHLAGRCTDSEAGARSVDHVLRGSLMPALSRALLEKMVGGERFSRVGVGLEAGGGWRFDFEEVRA
jgi:type VI secretion system protein VasG